MTDNKKPTAPAAKSWVQSKGKLGAVILMTAGGVMGCIALWRGGDLGTILAALVTFAGGLNGYGIRAALDPK